MTYFLTHWDCNNTNPCEVVHFLYSEEDIYRMASLYFISHRISINFTGGEYYNRTLLAGAKKAGFSIECWEGDKYGPLKKNIFIMNFIYFYKALFVRCNSYILLDMDFYARAVLAIWWASYVNKNKIIAMLHHYHHLDKYNFLTRKIHFALERYVSKKCDFLITNSKFSVENFRFLSKNDIPVFVLSPFSRDTEELPKERAKFKSDCQRLLMVGSIERRKNIINTIKAFSLLKRPFKCDVVGFWPSEDYLQSVIGTIQSLGLKESITLHGNIDRIELLKKYSEATVFILVSRMEGYGMVYAEAMGFGLPIVATTRGAVPELVEDGVNGFLCDPDNVAQITDAINKLGYKETWERISANNLAKARTLKSRSQFENESCEIFKNILKQ